MIPQWTQLVVFLSGTHNHMAKLSPVLPDPGHNSKYHHQTNSRIFFKKSFDHLMTDSGRKIQIISVCLAMFFPWHHLIGSPWIIIKYTVSLKELNQFAHIFIYLKQLQTWPICSGCLSSKGGPVTGFPASVWSAQHAYFFKPNFATVYVDGFEITVPDNGLGLLGDGNIWLIRLQE